MSVKDGTLDVQFYVANFHLCIDSCQSPQCRAGTPCLASLTIGPTRDSIVLLQDRPATKTGVRYSLPDIEVLDSMGQAVSKRRPTRLGSLGVVVSLLCDMGRCER